MAAKIVTPCRLIDILKVLGALLCWVEIVSCLTVHIEAEWHLFNPKGRKAWMGSLHKKVRFDVKIKGLPAVDTITRKPISIAEQVERATLIELCRDEGNELVLPKQVNPKDCYNYWTVNFLEAKVFKIDGGLIGYLEERGISLYQPLLLRECKSNFDINGKKVRGDFFVYKRLAASPLCGTELNKYTMLFLSPVGSYKAEHSFCGKVVADLRRLVRAIITVEQCCSVRRRVTGNMREVKTDEDYVQLKNNTRLFYESNQEKEDKGNGEERKKPCFLRKALQMSKLTYQSPKPKELPLSTNGEKLIGNNRAPLTSEIGT